MAGAMRKMGIYLGLVPDELPDDYDELDAELDDDLGRDEPRRDYRSQDIRPEPATRTLSPVRDTPSTTTRTPSARSAAPRAVVAEEPDSYRITTLHPRNYNDARTVGEYFRDGTPVIMNLTDMGDSDAKRLVDFAAGLVYGLHGTIERVTAKVFLLSPVNVTVTAEEKARLAEGGFFNQS
jgi:cell division inhibitor SepF